MDGKQRFPLQNPHLPDKRLLKLVLFWVFALGLTAHGYRFFNANFNHDSMQSLYEQSPELMISVGRFLRPVYRLLRGNFALPALGGILSLVYIAAAAYLLLRLLDVHNKWLIALVCGILTVNSSVSLMNASYVADTDAYSFAFLLAVLGVWAAKNWKHGIAISILCYFCSLGIYQAYISAAVFVLLLLALMELLRGQPVKKVYGRLAVELLAVLAAIVLYYVTVKLTQGLTHINDAEIYNTVDSLPSLSFQVILERIKNCASSEVLWATMPRGHSRGLLLAVNLLMGALMLVCGIGLIRKRRLNAVSVWGIAGIVVAMPFGINIATLISGVYHWLTMFSFNLLYLMVLVLAQMGDEEAGAKRRRIAWAVMAAVLVYDGCLLSNEIYLKKEMESAATLSSFTRIIDRMENTPGFVPGQTKVALIGEMDKSPLSKQREGFDYNGTGLWQSFSVTHYDSAVAYLTYYLSYPVTCVSVEELISLEQDARVVEVPIFPAQGSVQMIDDVMVVKLAQPVNQEAS